MAVKKDVRQVKSKKDKTKFIKKTTYKCEGSYIDLNGKAHRYHKRGFASSDDAKDWERIFLLKATKEIDSNITYNDLLQLYLSTKANGVIKDRTLNDMIYTFNSSILPFWKDIKLSKINLKHIETYQKELLEKTYTKDNQIKPLANRTLDSIQVQFKAVLRYGFKTGYITDIKLISFDYVKRNTEQKREMLFWHPEEFKKFIISVDELVYIALFNVLYWCGLRLGESLALSWKDINFKDKTIRINKSYSKHTHQITAPKTSNSYRTVIMPDRCISAIEDLYEVHKSIIGFDDEKFLFNFEKQLDENSIRLKKERWIKKADVKMIRLHDLRHSHVSLLINQGFNPFDIAKRLGHTVEMVNNTYGHWFNDAQQKMIDKLNTLDI